MVEASARRECGHPEMRTLPDGVYHCPACRSEVLPTKSIPDVEKTSPGSVHIRRTGAFGAALLKRRLCE